MTTKRSAQIYVTNSTGARALIRLYHKNRTYGVQSVSDTVDAGESVGPLHVEFDTEVGSYDVMDYWAVHVFVQSGVAAGEYVNAGSHLQPAWKECQLKHQDADKSLAFYVTSRMFVIRLDSGSCPDELHRIGRYRPINNVFVLMLENHSFDNIFGQSDIPGITHATTADSNTYNGVKYEVQSGAPPGMPTDPGHEFLDVVDQLAGTGYPFGGPYPSIDNSGFARNYATSTTETKVLPTPDQIGCIMRGFTAAQLPVITSLARDFAVCDHWFSSLPGPTWPNRFFVHGASSAGLDHSPNAGETFEWEVLSGFRYPRGSIFDALTRAGLKWRVYNDNTSAYSSHPAGAASGGEVPQVTALQGINLTDVESLKHFADDLRSPYPWNYTFIEPHYGDIITTYSGGSSQHPKDDVAAGERLISAVYSALRNSPLWSTSVLIITYDEHGGFYDSVRPGAAPAPNDGSDSSLNRYGFDFRQYGVRVPAVVVSPWVRPGTVDKAVRDHSSILATLEALFALPPLTDRDRQANDLTPLFSLASPRTDCPAATPEPPPSTRPPVVAEDPAAHDALPLPEEGNVPGFMAIYLKTDLELSSGSPAERAMIIDAFKRIKTIGDARQYVAAVLRKVAEVRALRAADAAAKRTAADRVATAQRLAAERLAAASAADAGPTPPSDDR